MTLAIFDLDNTLIGGDSDHAWGEFLVEQNLVDANHYRQANDRFYQEYQVGELDIDAYLRFVLAPLAGQPRATLQAWHDQFMVEKINPLMLPKAESLLARHRQAGHFLLIITATNRFITEPIANRLGVDDLLASEPEVTDGAYTGEATGTPCYQAGKVVRLNEWLARTGHSLSGSFFYTDSHNDIPLMETVDNPVVVDPDPQLRAYAETRNIPVISLR